MSDSFDLVVIGSGPGGYVAAIRAAQLGLKIACVDKGPVGGTCLNRGCIPTKALLEASHVVELAEHAAQFGIEFAEPKIDYVKLVERKDQVVGRLVRGIESLFKKNSIEFIQGKAEFASDTELKVTAADGTARTVQAKKTIIATGSEPLNIPAFPFDGDLLLSSTDILNLKAKPASLLIIGGGYIGCEFACFFAEIGTQVTVVEMMDRLLPLSDADISKEITTSLKKAKVKVHVGTKVEKVEKKDGKVVATLTGGKVVEADKALVSIGRKINSDGLAIEKAGVALGAKKEIPINDHCQTNVPNIYAIGDVTAKMMLAHVASMMGVVAAEHAAGKNVKMNYRSMPATVFTHPEAANVGLTEAEAVAQGREVKAFKFPIQVLGKAQAMGEMNGFIKLVGDAKTGELLGAHIVCSRAGDMIAEVALGMQLETTIEEIAKTIHVHPTLSEGVLEAAEGWLGHGIHYNG